MENKKIISKSTGVAVPLGALRTEKSPFIGEFISLPEFAEFCKNAGFSVIQLLPILDTGTHSSPYSSLSAFALHPIYISLSRIPVFADCCEKNKDFKAEYEELLSHKDDIRFDYDEILRLKESLLRKIFFMTFNSNPTVVEYYKKDFFKFIEDNAWVKPYAVFKSLKYKYMQDSWKNWSKNDKTLFQILSDENNENEINLSQFQVKKNAKIDEVFADVQTYSDIHFYVWEQFVADIQLSESVRKVRELGIKLKCDLPILLNEDSCDVWSTPEIFYKKLRAGSPPDGDNPTGQNWGFPVYDWNTLSKDDYSWWKMRLHLAEKYFDAYRLDHIPGFFRFWAVHEGEDTAELGATVPHSTISENAITKLGFSKERIRWLKEPHLSTEDFFRKTGDFEKAHKILSLFCERIGHEELWLFKKDFKSTADIKAVSLSDFELDEQIQKEITQMLCRWFKNRTLIELKKGQFVPYFKFGETRAWNTLNDCEKDGLLKLFEANRVKQEKAWENQADNIFSSIISSTSMVPCGEDLGVSIDSMPKVLDKYGILGLKVIRWCRYWNADNQPFEDFSKYRKCSLVTTSVHDSSTLRQWWDSERNSAIAFCDSVEKFKNENEKEQKKSKAKKSVDEVLNGVDNNICMKKFDSSVAEYVLSECASTNGIWFVNPLQDWLYLDDSFYSENAENERINIPGTVSKFNWTWRMPISVSKLSENENLIQKIQKICEKHDK